MLHRADQDVAFWCDAARDGPGPVLELACGTGRVAFPLADVGIEVVGADNDLAMLGAAQRRCASRPWPVFVAADMRRFAFAARFSLVFVAYNSLQLLTGPGEMADCLSRAREHLAPGGMVGIEVTDFQAGGADGPAPDPPEPSGRGGMLLGDADGIRLWGTLAHDLAARTSSYRRHFAGDGWTVEDEVVVRSLDRAELEAVLAGAGLVAIQWWDHGATLRALAAARE